MVQVRVCLFAWVTGLSGLAEAHFSNAWTHVGSQMCTWDRLSTIESLVRQPV